MKIRIETTEDDAFTPTVKHWLVELASTVQEVLRNPTTTPLVYYNALDNSTILPEGYVKAQKQLHVLSKFTPTYDFLDLSTSTKRETNKVWNQILGPLDDLGASVLEKNGENKFVLRKPTQQMKEIIECISNPEVFHSQRLTWLMGVQVIRFLELLQLAALTKDTRLGGPIESGSIEEALKHETYSQKYVRVDIALRDMASTAASTDPQAKSAGSTVAKQARACTGRGFMLELVPSKVDVELPETALRNTLLLALLFQIPGSIETGKELLPEDWQTYPDQIAKFYSDYSEWAKRTKNTTVPPKGVTLPSPVMQLICSYTARLHAFFWSLVHRSTFSSFVVYAKEVNEKLRAQNPEAQQRFLANLEKIVGTGVDRDMAVYNLVRTYGDTYVRKLVGWRKKQLIDSERKAWENLNALLVQHATVIVRMRYETNPITFVKVKRSSESLPISVPCVRTSSSPTYAFESS